MREFIHTYSDYLYKLVYGVLRDEAHAEDITQEVLLQILEALPHYRGEGLKTWMSRIAVNKAIDFKRSAYARREVVTAHQDMQLFLTTADVEVRPVENAVVESEQTRLIRQKIAQLPPKLKEVVIAYYIEGKSYQDIADQLQLEYKSVESRLYRARKWMREHWKEEQIK